MSSARFASAGTATLPAVPQSSSVLGDLLVVRDGLGTRLFDVAGAAPQSLGTADLGCIGLDLDRLTGNRETGVWAPGGDYGALRLGPQ